MRELLGMQKAQNWRGTTNQKDKAVQNLAPGETVSIGKPVELPSQHQRKAAISF